MDGEIITAMRTAAVSAVATKALAQETSILSVIGSGVQAKSHIEAFLKTFPITKVLTSSMHSNSWWRCEIFIDLI